MRCRALSCSVVPCRAVKCCAVLCRALLLFLPYIPDDNASKQTMLARASISSGILYSRVEFSFSKKQMAPLFYALPVCSNSNSMFEYVVVEYQNREHRTAERNHPCTTQLTMYVPIRVRVKRSMHVHACDVRVVFLEHGGLGICKSTVCTRNVGPSTTSVTPIYYSL